jgi:hypothetical protein
LVPRNSISNGKKYFKGIYAFGYWTIKNMNWSME